MGKIYCWGWNGLGQLGLGFYSNIPMGLRVSTPTGFYASSISLGVSHSCAEDLKNMEIICWGSNQFGQIDDSENYSYSEPRKISSDEGDLRIIIGDRHSCFYSTENDISCRGNIQWDFPTSSKELVGHSSGGGYLCLISIEKSIILK